MALDQVKTRTKKIMYKGCKILYDEISGKYSTSGRLEHNDLLAAQKHIDITLSLKQQYAGN